MKISLNAGILTAIGYSLFLTIITYYFGKSNPDIDKYRVIGIYFFLALGIISAMWIALKKDKNNVMSYRSAIRTGLLLTVFSSVLITSFTWIYLKYINPELISILIHEARESVMKNSTDPVMAEKYIDEMKKDYGVFRIFTSVLFSGLILSILIGLMFKREPSPSEN